MSRLAEEQHALAAQVRRLTEEQRALAEEQRALTAQVRQLAQKVDDLVTWQRREAGRREGERYERMTVKRGPVLFSGGMGGSTDNPVVQRRLVRWLKPIFESDRFLETGVEGVRRLSIAMGEHTLAFISACPSSSFPPVR
ncbi:hypothetical protein J7M22_10005 [Candidatus Poribacteria bacterium]|nr:hypothetical protein [Candidatus Poribacteria bacterium]